MSYDKSEPMKAPWFSWSPEGGFEFHATAAEARQRAEDELEAEREDAPDGWSEWVDEICWGRAYGAVTEIERRPPTDEDFGVTRQAEEIVDYALVDDVPALSAEEIAALVECERQLRSVVPPGEDWWCPTCCAALSGSRVTFEERCDTCGTALTEVNAKSWGEAARAALARLDAARKEQCK